MHDRFLTAACVVLAAACTGGSTAVEPETPTASAAAPAAEVTSPPAEAPAGEEPVVVEAPAVDEPAVDEPPGEEPVVEVPVAEAVVTGEEPAVEAPAVDEQPVEAPAVDERPVEMTVVDEESVIELVVIGSELEGGARRQSVPLGEEVSVRVVGTSTDHVHVHGYDLFIDLVDGAGELTFTASIPGVFEIELEESGTLLIQMEVK